VSNIRYSACSKLATVCIGFLRTEEGALTRKSDFFIYESFPDLNNALSVAKKKQYP
jgi:hypothetical protein